MLHVGDKISVPSTNRIISLTDNAIIVYLHCSSYIEDTIAFFFLESDSEHLFTRNERVLCVLSTSTANQAERRGFDTAFETFILGKE